MAAQKPLEHHCHAVWCETPVPPKMVMCRSHWFMVSKLLRDAVWAAYVPGQEIRKNPTPQYLNAMAEAIRTVAKKERQGEFVKPSERYPSSAGSVADGPNAALTV